MQSLTIRLHAPLPRDNVMSSLVVAHGDEDRLGVGAPEDQWQDAN